MMKVDRYMDISCCRCAKSRSTDYGMGMWPGTKASVLVAAARKEGWGMDKETSLPVCPECMGTKKAPESHTLSAESLDSIGTEKGLRSVSIWDILKEAKP